MSMCRVVSCVIGKGCFLWPECSLGKTVSHCSASFCTPRPNLPVIPGVSWLPTFAFQSPIVKRTSFLDVSSRRSCRSSQKILFNFSFFSIPGWGIDWDYCDMNGLPWKWTENILLFLRLHPSTEFWILLLTMIGYSISSKGFFLPTVVDIMVIWFKFTHSSPFQFSDS